MATYGKAYAFFDCNEPKEALAPDLSAMAEAEGLSSGLELSLSEVKELLQDGHEDRDLLKFVMAKTIIPTPPEKFRHLSSARKPVKLSDLKYIIEATLPGEPNEEAVFALLPVMNHLYFEFGGSKPFNVAVACKIGREYMFFQSDAD